jgi:methylmalonyl-CoA mutase C-terminal domain/subunit
MSDAKLRVLVGVLALDQHEAGALAVSRILRDAGMEVIYAGRFGLPETIVGIATDEDVNVIGISCHSWEFLYYAEQLATLAHQADPPIPVVVGGSVVTAADRDAVVAKGIDAAVLPGVSDAEVADVFRRLAAASGRRAS